MTRARISAEEARALREGRESKGAWDAGAEAVYAGHDTCPRHKPPADGGDLRARCECRAIGTVVRDGDRALCAAAPALTEEVEALHTEIAVATKERDHAAECATNARAEIDRMRAVMTEYFEADLAVQSIDHDDGISDEEASARIERGHAAMEALKPFLTSGATS